ncbi:hypothetical protein M3Y99_01333500 [Aphelenchoides fujianensis]|nr:hypothetical protein M3Y99_01333500 [Aphelenchoides fujianensis]
MDETEANGRPADATPEPGPSNGAATNGELKLEADEEISTEGRALLTRAEALELLIEEKGDRLAPQWKTEDLAAVFARIRSTSCSEESIRAFIHVFENTTVEEVLELIASMQAAVREADDSRFLFDGFQPDAVEQRADDLEPDAAAALRKLAAVVATADKKRKLRSANSVRLLEAFKALGASAPATSKQRVSTDVFSPACQRMDTVSYAKIYEFLSEVAVIKKPKPLTCLESAIVQSIWEEIEELADDHFHEHVPFFRQLLRDVEDMRGFDFGVTKAPSMDEVGEKMWNTLSIPPQVMDLAAAYKELERTNPPVESHQSMEHDGADDPAWNFDL